MRNNEIYFFSKTRPVRVMHDGDGWTPGTVLDRAMPALSRRLLPPVRSARSSAGIPSDGVRDHQAGRRLSRGCASSVRRSRARTAG
ncbi:hypothetical protein AB5I41_08570 [Sphingomonas sp. MMS24-JH45]